MPDTAIERAALMLGAATAPPARAVARAFLQQSGQRLRNQQAGLPDFVAQVEKNVGANNRMTPYLKIFTDVAGAGSKFRPVLPMSSQYSTAISKAVSPLALSPAICATATAV